MSTRSSTLTRPQDSVGDSEPLSNLSTATTGNKHLKPVTKAVYQADQQVKFLHLQAEVEILLQQLQTIKQQRLASDREIAATPSTANPQGS
ncbi:MAG: hypothetical protein AB1861_15070 [Cyanobacteriota bacterium]